MKEIKNEEVLSDYFELTEVKEIEGGDATFEVFVKPKGREFLDKKAKEIENFDEDKYIQDLFIKALTKYIDDNEKIQAGEIEG